MLRGAFAALVPHSAYHQSGRIAGLTLARVAIPRCCLILGANHTDAGARWSLLGGGAYETPLGEVPVDERLAAVIAQRCGAVEFDETAHRGEHAIEVVLPLLQWLGPERLGIAPIVVRAADADEAREVGQTLADIIRTWDEPVLVIASCELGHFGACQDVRAADEELLNALCRVDRELVRAQVTQREHTACGAGALMCAVEIAKALGASCGEVAGYATSADVGGDPHSATGYAGLVWSRT